MTVLYQSSFPSNFLFLANFLPAHAPNHFLPLDLIARRAQVISPPGNELFQQGSMAPTQAPEAASEIVAGPSYIENPEVFLLLSVLLRLVIYIRNDGEVRLAPDCRLSEDPKTGDPLQMLSVCETGNWTGSSTKRCLFASKSMKHILAMDSATGRLVAIPSPAEKPQITSNASSPLCTWFEIVKTSKLFHENSFRRLIIGCPDNERRHMLAFRGDRLRMNTDCLAAANRVFAQVPTATNSSSSSAAGREGHFVFVPLAGAASDMCGAPDCGDVTRHSYPLHWQSCSPSV